MRICTESDPVYLDGKRYDDFWEKGTVPESREQFRKISQHLTDVLHERNGQIYPEIPCVKPEHRKAVESLDQVTYKTYLENLVQGPLHPHVEHVIENYFWTTFATSYTETSAAAGLNFMAADFEDIAVTPGGNAGIAESVLIQLLKAGHRPRLRTSSLVFDVRVVPDGVNVTYVNGEGKVHTVQSKYVIMSCPKFVASKVLRDIEPERLQAMQSLKYRAFLVANVLLNQGLPPNFFDLYFIRNGNQRMTEVKQDSDHQQLTDAVYGNRAQPHPGKTVLTMYRAFPYDGARAEIYAPDAYVKFKNEFKKQIVDHILPELSLRPESLEEVRLARWGHPLPLFQVGNVASGKLDLLRKPFRNRVFFSEQDNWTLPCFETAFYEAQACAEHLRKVLV